MVGGRKDIIGEGEEKMEQEGGMDRRRRRDL